MQTPRTQPMNTAARRVLILMAGIGVLAAVKRAYDTWFRPAGKIEQGTGTFPDLTGLSKEVTPADEFYTVSKNSVDPVVREAVWKLEVAGQVKNPGSFTIEDLRRMRILSMYATLFDDPGTINTILARYLSVTADEIRDVAAEVFRTDNRVVLTYLPAAGPEGREEEETEAVHPVAAEEADALGVEEAEA